MQLHNNFEYSYWELKQYFKKFDLIVIGSGIVGLSAAISFKQKNKNAAILILERGLMPNGASTKNAGFACFGSAGEILDDLHNTSDEKVWQTVEMRWKGLQMLRKRLGDTALGFEQCGGYEVFDNHDEYQTCVDQRPMLNKKIKEFIGLSNCYKVVKINSHFKNISGTLFNAYEGQIDTGAMMRALVLMALKKNILILNNISVQSVTDLGVNGTEILSSAGVFKASKVVVATNGFASQLLELDDVLPARAQVLVTHPIKHLKIKGTFHYQQGYYYFRNIDNRILLGGGRNIDIKGETSTDQILNQKIQGKLDQFLQQIILPGVNYTIDHRWTGIMGVGKEKSPIIQHVSDNVIAAVRMGGMGIAIGTWVGEKAAGIVG